MNIQPFFTKTKLLIISGLLLISSVLFVAYDDDDFELSKNLDIYHTLFRELNLYYVDKTKSGELIKSSIDAMLKGLDPYTNYIPESMIEDYRFMTTGEYGGIGAMVHQGKDYIIISEPYENSPAQKAGLKAGDVILEVDGNSTKGKTVEGISTFLKGQPGSKIKMLVQRMGNPTPFTKEITREKITIKNVPYFGMLNDKVGYISLTGFTQNAGKEVKEALVELKTKHNAKAIVLDLRDNPGGLLNEAVNIVNLFVPRGQEIVSMKGKVSQWNSTFYGTSDPVDTEIPLTVIVNNGSASASEIVSGALQDLDRAVIIGQRSYGKGLVQTTRPLSYNAQLKVTVAKYYIPSGRCIQALDYSHRNADGSVGKVPDSLITAFKTKNGRKVFDGGGIMPDEKIENPKLSNLTSALTKKNILFEYATLYAQKHDSIASPQKFALTDKEYNEFVQYLEKEHFNYETQSEEQLKKLIAQAQNEKYYETASSEFEALKKKLAHDQSKDFKLFKKEIKEILQAEIASRYYYQKGRVQSQLANDDEIHRAIELLTEDGLKSYQKILKKM